MEELAAIGRDLQGGACPQLVKLDLSACCLSNEHGRALAPFLRSMACPKLEELNLSGNVYIRDDEVFNQHFPIGDMKSGAFQLYRHYHSRFPYYPLTIKVSFLSFTTRG